VAAAESADGRVVVDIDVAPEKGTARGAVTLRATDLASGKVTRIPMDVTPRPSLQLTPDGRYVSAFLLARDSRVLVLDTRTGEVVFRRPYPADEWVLATVPAPDGPGLARSVVGTRAPQKGEGGPGYAAVAVTDHATGRTWKMDPVPWSVYPGGVGFSRDGTRVLLRGRFAPEELDCVSVWDARTGRRLVTWSKRPGRADAMGLSADSRSLLVGDQNGRLSLVEVATGLERAAFEHRGEVYSAAFFPDGTRAVSSSPDGPVYVWDLLGAPGPWDAAKADAVWADLASSDARVAFAAVRKLRGNPREAVGFLAERVKVPAAPADEQVGRWLKDLDAPRFAAREQAQKELTAAADLIRPKLEAARKAATEEAGRRLDEILKAADRWTAEKLRHGRACEVLEGVGTPEAVRVLKGWTAGPAGAVLTTEARQSGDRLNR
jgi:hypothetical protein